LNLNAGWNAVAFQDQRLATLTPNPAIAGLVRWVGTYEFLNFDADAINAAGGGRRAYWVFATGGTTLTYTGMGDGGGDFVDLSLQGYQLVSFSNREDIPGGRLAASQNGQSVPLTSVVLTPFYEIGPTNQYTPVDPTAGGVIRAGRAYWVFANTGAGTVRLTVTASPGASPSPGSSPQPSPAASAQPSPTGSPSPLPAGRMYVPDALNNVVRAFPNAATLSGAPSPSVLTEVPGPSGVAVDGARDRLYVSCTVGGGALRVIHNASNARGPITDSLSATVTGFVVPYSTLYDASHDRLYVGEGGAKFWVFEPASQLTDGTALALASRSLSGLAGPVTGLALDATKDRLFVLNGAANDIRIFDNASTVSGANSTAGGRTVTGPATGLTGSTWGLALDERRQLLYASTATGVLVFDNLDTLTGDRPPVRQLTGLPASQYHALVLDSTRDCLYVTGGETADEVRIFENASTFSGAVPASRTLTNVPLAQGLTIDFTR